MAPQEEDLFDEEPPTVDPYSVLGVSKTATDTEIKSAYRKAALRNHPGMRLSLHAEKKIMRLLNMHLLVALRQRWHLLT
jgi:DnaJ family protein C protein 9